LGIVEEEADESEFWLDMIIERKWLKASRVEPLRQEASEIVAIMVASRKSAARRGLPPIKNQNSKIKNADALRK
jgi:3,4-dihydroxy-2-butanone 4-phosphate synthase